MQSQRLRILVVDDTVLYRNIVKNVLSEIPNVEVIGTAHNGQAALLKLKTLKPDLMTLDIEMPEMTGIELLQIVKKEHLDVGVIMLSTLTQEGGAMTMKALDLGAFDFITKPQLGTMSENLSAIKNSLLPILREFERGQNIRTLLRGKLPPIDSKLKQTDCSQKKAPVTSTIDLKLQGKSEIIAIGVSTGGPKALSETLPKISGSIGVPILIVQHMPPLFTQSLAKSLDSKCELTVKEANHGEPILPNTAYIAPGGKQMKIAASPDGKNRLIHITNDPPENSCRPSADYLFRSVAHHYVGRATGVIMTGMGFDGFLGLEMMKKNGAIIIAQNEETCVVYGMPKKPIEMGIVDVIAPLDLIPNAIMKTVKFPSLVIKK